MDKIISPVNIEERKNLDIRPGDIVRVHQKIEEKGKTRLQVFEGLVLLMKHGRTAGGTFTVRKVASGVGVEKIFPIYSPNISKIEIVSRGKARRAKLYFIRDKATKAASKKMRQERLSESITMDESITPETKETKEEVVV